MTKYENISTEGLVKAIQRAALQIPLLKGTKNGSSKIADIEKSLYELRQEVIPRLRRLDRCHCSFFPVGSHVIYQQYQPPQGDDDWTERQTFPQYSGVVTAHTVEGKVHVRFEGLEYLGECEAKDLKLKFIR